MITSDLFDEILINPVKDNGASKLFIVSGYASGSMASFHFESFKNLKADNVHVQLIVGMTHSDGIARVNHHLFKELVTHRYPGRFKCNYLVEGPSIHSKMYGWANEEGPCTGYIGSANYSQPAFLGPRREAMIEHDPVTIIDYYHSVLNETVECIDAKAEDLVTIYDAKHYRRKKRVEELEPEESEFDVDTGTITTNLLHIEVDFVRGSSIPTRSHLNWGHRNNRELNQAYIPLRSSVYNTDFFPPLGHHFTVICDDGTRFACVRAQVHGKAIETPRNNSILGRYFRRRMGLPLGSLVTLNDMQRYGRTTVDFYRVDDETYFMDFSV